MTKIYKSVGLGGDNRLDDVGKIQALLNLNETQPALVIDELIGPKTIDSINQVQRKFSVSQTGRIDPMGAFLRELISQAVSKKHSTSSYPLWGPQSFAPAAPGTIAVNKELLAENQDLGWKMKLSASNFYTNQDLRWFFAIAHAFITLKIVDRISSFQRPNAILLLNRHFASEFMRAISGLPHANWRAAFIACKALDIADQVKGIPGEVEACGASMAYVHIHTDLKKAIDDVGCIPPQDYGNVLTFVQGGAAMAINKLRGEFVGWIEIYLKNKLPEWMQLEQIWRDSVYIDSCHVPVVPKPQQQFGR